MGCGGRRGVVLVSRRCVVVCAPMTGMVAVVTGMATVAAPVMSPCGCARSVLGRDQALKVELKREVLWWLAVPLMPQILLACPPGDTPWPEALPA